MNEIKRFRVFFLLITILFVSIPLSGDQRDESINVFLVLDKSLSMEEEIEEVKDYIQTTIIDTLLIPGDRLHIITFYGQNELLYNSIINDRGDKADINHLLDTVKADGRFTDIGSALDRLISSVDRIPASESGRNYLLLLTDGIQEAPPESPYYTPDGSFNHRLLENTKTISMKGWKIQILGIGTESAAKEIANALSAGYSTVQVSGSDASSDSSSDDAGETEEAGTDSREDSSEDTPLSSRTAESFLGRIDVIGTPAVKIKYTGQTGVCRLKLESVYFTEKVAMELGPIVIVTEHGEFIAEPDLSIITMDSGQSSVFDISFEFTDVIPQGEHTGMLKFSFLGQHSFSPGAFEAEFRVPSFYQAYWWVFLIVLIVIAAIIIYVVLRIRGYYFKKQSEDKEPGNSI